MTDIIEKKPDVPKLRGSDRFLAADYIIPRYAASVPAGTKLTDIVHPQYFIDHLAKLKKGMDITVLSEDLALDARLRVLSVGVQTAKVRILEVFAGGDASEVAAKVTADDLAVNFGGPSHKWRFQHGTAVIQHGFENKEAAEEAAAKYLETINK